MYLFSERLGKANMKTIMDYFLPVKTKMKIKSVSFPFRLLGKSILIQGTQSKAILQKLKLVMFNQLSAVY